MIILLLLLILPREPETLVDQVDVIEINHLFSRETGEETFSQVIYWRWDAGQSAHRVTAWRPFTGRPAWFRRDRREWIETREDGPTRREIHARQHRETWTFEDPELLDRAFVSPEMRRGLRPLTPADAAAPTPRP